MDDRSVDKPLSVLYQRPKTGTRGAGFAGDCTDASEQKWRQRSSLKRAEAHERP
jgi:hypothetical protein